MQLSNSDEPPNAWLLTPAHTLLQYIVDEQTIAGVTHRALLSVRSTAILLAIARDQIPNATAETKEAFQQAITTSAGDLVFAEKEAKTGFNTLFSHTAVGTWGAIETSLENTLLNHLRRVPNAEALIRSNAPEVKDKLFRRAAVGGGSEETLLKGWEGVLRDIPTVMARQLHMLTAFGLRVSLESDNERVLSELAELRNVILHRGGVVDQRFKNKCPWRGDTVGDRVYVTYETMRRYFEAAGDLAVKLIGAAAQSPYIYSSKSA